MTLERTAGPARVGQLLNLADLSATALFALEGAAAAAAADQDVLGIVVIAFVTALGGGLMRDLILGESPPAALDSRAYLVLVVASSLIVVIVTSLGAALPTGLLEVLDAGGLGLFCVAGTAKAMQARFNGGAAVLLGTLTGCGGGMIRDVLLNRVPVVLHSHIYALAALAGAACVVLLPRVGLSKSWAMAAGFSSCVAFRLLAITYDWNLPHVHG